MTDKMTNAKALAYVLANCEIPSEVADKLTAIKASIEKKNAHKSDKPTAKQAENEAIKPEEKNEDKEIYGKFGFTVVVSNNPISESITPLGVLEGK